MSSIQLVPVRADMLPQLAHICYDAFGRLQERHGVEKDFDSIETAAMVVGMFASRADFYGVAAQVDGKIVGSNFISFTDPVSGVGPIAVDPTTQSRGVGKALMQAVLDEASRRGVQQVRLQQEAINTTSLSLYTKLGFDWREACALVRPQPAERDAADVRPVTEEDLPAIHDISARQYGSTRHNEVAAFLNMQIPGLALQRGREIVGYYFPGFLGHGFAPTGADMAHLITQTMRHAPPHFQKVIVPLGQHELHRTLLGLGARTIKLLNYMSFGPWTAPSGAWIPSIGM